LKADALLAEQQAQALMADVVDHPLGDQEVRQLGQAPGRERQTVIGRPAQRSLLDLLALRQGELWWAPAAVLGTQRVEAVGVEVVEHVPDAIGTGKGDLGDPRDVQPLRGQQHHLRPPPRHDRPTASTHHTQQLVALVAGDAPDLHTSHHLASPGGSQDQTRQDQSIKPPRGEP